MIKENFHGVAFTVIHLRWVDDEDLNETPQQRKWFFKIEKWSHGQHKWMQMNIEHESPTPHYEHALFLGLINCASLSNKFHAERKRVWENRRKKERKWIWKNKIDWNIVVIIVTRCKCIPNENHEAKINKSHKFMHFCSKGLIKFSFFIRAT